MFIVSRLLHAIRGRADAADPTSARAEAFRPASPFDKLEPRLLLSGEPVFARIVNGQETDRFPAVGVVAGACTGTLITSRHVLTAAHCVDGLDADSLDFQLVGPGLDVIDVDIHPDYDPLTLDNDVAVLTLARDYRRTPGLTMLRESPVLGETLTLVGFGAGGTPEDGADGTFGVKRTGTTELEEITATQIAWNFDDPNEANTAPGDSGGPALVRRGNRWVIAGITSGGEQPDAGLGDRAFDVRVDAFVNWIDDQLAGYLDPDDHRGARDSRATPITAPSLADGGGTVQTSGLIANFTDRDTFRFTLDQFGKVVIRANAATRMGFTEPLDAKLQLFDSDGKLIDSALDLADSMNARLNKLLPAGDYFASVVSENQTSTGAFNFSLTTKSPVVLPDAESIALNANGVRTVEDRIGRVVQSQAYRVTAINDGPMTINVLGSGRLDPKLAVFDEFGNRLGQNDDFGMNTNSRLVLNVTAGQTLFIRVSSFRGSFGDFTMRLLNQG